MSRIRSIHPGFFTDEDLVGVSMAARLLFLGIGVHADDKGVFEWKPRTLKMKVFPGDNLDMEELLAELQEVGSIRRYEIEGRAFGAIRNFRKFQRPKTPNDIHPATPEILQFVGLASEIKADEQAQFPLKGEIPPQMEDGGDKMEDGGDKVDTLRADSADQISDVFNLWNAMAESCGLSRCTKVSDKRRASCRSRLKADGFAAIQVAIEKIPKSSFLTGATSNDGWQADIDFFLRPDSITKILEGKYDDRARKEPRQDEPQNPYVRAVLERQADRAGVGF